MRHQVICLNESRLAHTRPSNRCHISAPRLRGYLYWHHDRRTTSDCTRNHPWLAWTRLLASSLGAASKQATRLSPFSGSTASGLIARLESSTCSLGLAIPLPIGPRDMGRKEGLRGG
jgi:hypothetical protein